VEIEWKAFCQHHSSELGVHYRLDDGSVLCGAADGMSTRDPWSVACSACLAVARAESVAPDITKPHPFVHTVHCSACLALRPKRQYDAKPWNGSI
jgi:hypothetical protein